MSVLVEEMGSAAVMWTAGWVRECELVVTEGCFLQIYAWETCTASEALVPVHAESWVGCVQSWLENWEHWNWESCSGKNCHQLKREKREKRKKKPKKMNMYLTIKTSY